MLAKAKSGGTAARRIGAGAGAAILALAAATFAMGATGGDAAAADVSLATLGEARTAAVTVGLAPAVADVALTEGRSPGRPIVVIDPGHGGRDPGAIGVSGSTAEKDLTLALAKELREQLAKRGRVRVALTRESDRYLTLDERASVARRLGASLYLSLHMDAAPNPLARGASVYSLSDVASDAQAARHAQKENAAAGPLSDTGPAVPAILADLAMRDQMKASAQLAERLVRKSRGKMLLRPEPHRFASFYVLRQTGAPSVLFEAGYVSNADDEAMLIRPEHRAQLASALAQAIETDVAFRIAR